MGVTSPLQGPADTLAQLAKQREPGRETSGFGGWRPPPVSAPLPIVEGFKDLRVTLDSCISREEPDACRKVLSFVSCAAKTSLKRGCLQSHGPSQA